MYDASTRLDGFTSLIPKYDAFVLDQWGVLHDGNTLYPQVNEFLRLLRQAARKVLVLTNSSKSCERNKIRLRDRFGLPPTSYHELISSAQLLRDHLGSGALSATDGRPANVYVVADEGDEVLVQGLPVQVVHDPESADAVALLSSLPGKPLAAHSWIPVAADKGLPILCPSVDSHTVRPDGVAVGMQRIIVECEKRGALVTNFGKPSPGIYAHCKDLLGDVEPERILAVGDQIPSDVVGAHGAGWDTALVETGAGRNSLRELGARYVTPDFIIPELRP